MARRTGLRRTNRKNLRKSMRKSMRKGMKRRVKRNTMKRRNTNRKVSRNTNRKVRRNTMKRRNNRRMVGGMVAVGWHDVWQDSWLAMGANFTVSKYGWVPCAVKNSLAHMFDWRRAHVEDSRYKDGAFIIIDGNMDIWVSTLEGAKTAPHLFAADVGAWEEQDSSIIGGMLRLKPNTIGMISKVPEYARIGYTHHKKDGSSLDVRIPPGTIYAYAPPGEGATQMQFQFLTGHSGRDGNKCDYTFEPDPAHYLTPEKIGTIHDVIDFLNSARVPPDCEQMLVQMKTWMNSAIPAELRSSLMAAGTSSGLGGRK